MKQSAKLQKGTEGENNIFSIRSFPVGAFILVILLLLFSYSQLIPAWLVAFTFLICAYRYISFKRYSEPVGRSVKTCLTIASVAVFIAHYKTNFTIEMAASFLFLTSVLKFIEIRTGKDLVTTVYTLLYLSAVSFLFSQSILHTLLQITIISISLYILLKHNIGYEYSMGKKDVSLLSHLLFKVLMFAIPLVLICFVFFPRISPLWSMPIKTQSAKTGMSNAMSPGDIAELTKSSEVAFRVDFDGAVPEKRDLYWRGLVLDHFDGREWRQSPAHTPYRSAYKIDSGSFREQPGSSYRVMLEPHQQRWVFALEGAKSLSSNLLESDMGLYTLKTDAIQATYYKMSYQQREDKKAIASQLATINVLEGVDRKLGNVRQDLQRPPKNKNPRAQAYMSELKTRFERPEDLLAYLMEQFKGDGFYYTLKPPQTGEHFVDEFMFDLQRGFCAHYAGSLAYLLRLASIPARVVIGYQGGEMHSSEPYMIVRQYDAHAWVEVFLANKGWVRVDPTAMVSPDRILDGSGEAYRSKEGFLENSLFASAALNVSLINWLSMYVDKIDYGWQKWVVNYNQSEQEGVVKGLLGEYSLAAVASFFVYVLLAIILGMFGYIYLSRYAFKYTWAEKKYMMSSTVLALWGWKREKGETPRAFLGRVEAGASPYITKFVRLMTKSLEQQQYEK